MEEQIKTQTGAIAQSSSLKESRSGFIGAPALEPDFGSGQFVRDSFVSAWNYNLTKSAWDYAEYFLKGKTGNVLQEDEFAGLLEQDGLTGALKWKEGMTEEQYALMSGIAKDNINRMERMRVSSQGRTGRGLAASLAGGIADPAMLPIMLVPGLNVEFYAVRMGVAAKMGLTYKQASQFAKTAPASFRQMAVSKGVTSSGVPLYQSFGRGAAFGTAEAIVLEPAIYAFNTAVQKEYGILDSLINIGASGLLGGTINTGINIYGRARTGGKWQAAIEGRTTIDPKDLDGVELAQMKDNFAAFNEIAQTKGMTPDRAADLYVEIGLGRQVLRDEYINLFNSVFSDQAQLRAMADILDKAKAKVDAERAAIKKKHPGLLDEEVDDLDFGFFKKKKNEDTPEFLEAHRLAEAKNKLDKYRAQMRKKFPDLFDENEHKFWDESEGAPYYGTIDDVTWYTRSVAKHGDELSDDTGIGPLGFIPETMLAKKDQPGRLNQRITFDELHQASRPARRTDPKVRLTEESIISDLYESTFGVEVRFMEPKQAAELGFAGRVYSRHGDTLFITASDQPTMSFIAGHEMLHGIKAQDAKLFLGIIDSINSWDKSGVLLKGLEDRVASLTDKQFSSIPLSKHMEENYANLFGELISDANFWRHMQTRVTPTAMAQFRRALKELIERLTGVLSNIASSYGIDIGLVAQTGPKAKKRTGLLEGVPERRVQQMIKELSDLMQSYDATSIDPYHAKVGSKKYDQLIQERIISRVAESRKAKKNFWENNTKRFRARMEDEANVVFWNTQDEAPASLLRQDPLFDWAQTHPIKKEGMKNIRAYALSIPSARNRDYSRAYANYLKFDARERSLRGSLGPQIGAMRKKLGELSTRIQRADDEKNKEAYSRLLRSRRDMEKTLRRTSQDFAMSHQRTRRLSDDLMNMGQVIVEDTGTHYIVHYNKNVRDTVVQNPLISDPREMDGLATGSKLQFGDADATPRVQRQVDARMEADQVDLEFGSYKEGDEYRWFDPAEPERVLSWDEVAEANDWVMKDSDSMMLRDDVDDVDVRQRKGANETIIDPTVDWDVYAMHSRGGPRSSFGDKIRFDEGYSQVDFEGLASFLGRPEPTTVQRARANKNISEPEFQEIVSRDFAQWKEKLRQEELSARMEEESDDLSFDFLRQLKERAKEGTIKNMLLGQDNSARNRIWDRMRVGYRADQRYDARVIDRVRRQGEAYAAKFRSERDIWTAGKTVGEAIEDSELSPQFMDLTYKLIAPNWKKGLAKLDPEEMKGLSSSERTLFTRIQQLYNADFFEASMLKRVFAKSKGNLSRERITQLLLDDNRAGSRISESKAGQMYDRMMQTIASWNDPSFQGRLNPSQVVNHSERLSSSLQEQSYRTLLREVRTEQARRSWVDQANTFGDKEIQVKYMLSRMDGQYRKGLAPGRTPVSISNKMRARQIEDLNPLLQVMARMGGMWDELTSPQSLVMQDVFLYVKTKNEKLFSGFDPETTAMLKELGDTLSAINQVQTGVLRDLGSDVTHRPDYTITLKHQKYKIEKVDFEVWQNRILSDLDWDQTFQRLGVRNWDEDAKLRYIRQVYDDIMNDRFRAIDDPADNYMAMLHKETSYARTMIFKPEAEWKYDVDFGSGSPTHSLLEQIRRRSDLAVLMEEFGPNPQQTWAKIKNDLKLSESNLSVQQLDKLVEFHTGAMDNPANQKMAAWGQLARTYANSVVLGNAGITSMTDMVHSIDLLNYYGVPLGTLSKNYWGAVARAWQRNKKGSQFQLAMRTQGAGADPTLSATSRRLGGEAPASEAVRKSSDVMFSLNLLNMQTTIAQEALVDSLNRNLAMLIDTGDFTPTLRRYGLNDAEIRLIRESEASVMDIDGPVMKIIPDNVAEKDPIAARKLRYFLDDSMRQGVLEPTATGQMFARLGTRSGTIQGEIVRGNTMYMAFGMSVFQKTYRRMLYGYKDQGFIEIFKNPMNRRALNMMSFAAWSMALGYVTMNAKEVLRGREPVHLGNMNDMNMRKWLWQSGVAGVVSDLIWARDIADAGKFLVGPPLSMSMNQAQTVADRDPMSFAQTAERNLPFATLPVVGELRRQLFAIFLGEALKGAHEMHHNLFDPTVFSPNNSGKGPLEP